MTDFVTFSRNVFIPVTNVCRNRCGYCTFRREPDEAGLRFLSPEDIIPILKEGKKAGCSEVLFTFGEYAEEVPEYKRWLEEMDYSSNIEYVIDLCKLAIRIGLLPHTNAGVLNYVELESLKPWNASMGLMLETTGMVPAHLNCPGKQPDVRIKTIRYAGELQIPFTTGILIGIGETLDDRIDSLQCISDLHVEYGHIQEVIIQNFIPKPGTSMEKHAPPTIDEMVQMVSIAREILPADIAIQVPPNLIDPYLLVQCGATDLGGISPTTIDWINPETEWPTVDNLQELLKDIPLRERLPIYPDYIKKGWYSKHLKLLIRSMADNDGYRRPR